MKLLVPEIFKPFPEVVAAMSLRDEKAPGSLSMLKNGCDEQTARANRDSFCKEMGFKINHLVYPIQVHSADIHVVSEKYNRREGDAVATKESGWLLGITVADCVPLLLYDPKTRSYGAVHSGWRGSSQNIAGLSIDTLMQQFGVRPENILAWIGPAAGRESYEAGYDVVSQFNPKYSQNVDEERWLFDNKSVVRDQLIDAGVSPEQIEVCGLDTITNKELHSARRDGDESGRMLASIGLQTT